MTKAEAWDKLVERVNEINIQKLLEHNGDPMNIVNHVFDYRNVLMDIDGCIKVYSNIVKLSEEEQSDEGA